MGLARLLPFHRGRSGRLLDFFSIHLSGFWLFEEQITVRSTSAMVAAWRQAGMSYIQYSALCARLLRRALKPEYKTEALKVEETAMRITQWENGAAKKEQKKD